MNDRLYARQTKQYHMACVYGMTGAIAEAADGSATRRYRVDGCFKRAEGRGRRADEVTGKSWARMVSGVAGLAWLRARMADRCHGIERASELQDGKHMSRQRCTIELTCMYVCRM